MLEIKNANGNKEAFDGLISRLDTAEEELVSSKTYEQKLPK